MTSIPSEVEVLQRNQYYSFGMEQEGAWTAATTPRMDYTYNGKELQEELGLNWLAFGFRMYDPAIGRFPSVDPLAHEYVSISPYAYVANNPIIFIDPDGRYIDLGNLSEDEKRSYQNKVERLMQNEMFAVYYTRLEKSNEIYTILRYEGEDGIYYDPKSNTVGIDFSLEGIAQELFHAFQDDLGVYEKGVDDSVIETEGDLMSSNVVLSLGHAGTGLPWDQGIRYNPDYSDNDLNYSEGLFSNQFNQEFHQAVDARVQFYKNRESLGVSTPESYTMKNSGKEALAIKKVVREKRANQLNYPGPRLPNGDYYSK